MQAKAVAWAAFALVAGFLLASTGVQAKATFTTFTLCGPYPTVDLDHAARMWTDDEGVLHVRGAPYTVDLTGTYAGTFSGLDNYNADATNTGDAFGTMTATLGGLGTFEGRFNGTFLTGVEGGLVGQAVLHGDTGLITTTFGFPWGGCGGGFGGDLTLLTTGG